MPKKRTVMPCYGKKQQRLVQMATIIGKSGDADKANEVLDMAAKSWRNSLLAAAYRKKKRLSTPFLRAVPRLPDGSKGKYVKGEDGSIHIMPKDS